MNRRTSDGTLWADATLAPQHPTHITPDQVRQVMEILGFRADVFDATRWIHIGISEVTISEFLLNEHGYKYVDTVTGEVPMCENKIPVETDEQHTLRLAREQAELDALRG